jgi:hypothetical protein
MNQQDNTPIDVDASKPISRADKARGFVRNRRGLTCASRALVLMAWGLGAWCISRYWPADSSWSTEMLGLGSLLVGMLTVNIRLRRHQDAVPVHWLSAELQTPLNNAVQHSQILSLSSLSEVCKNNQAIESLTSHQENFVEALRQNQNCVRKVVGGTRHRRRRGLWKSSWRAGPPMTSRTRSVRLMPKSSALSMKSPACC